MSDTTGLFVLLLLAVLVGAVIPVLYQAVHTLRSARQFLDLTGKRLDESLREFTEATVRFNRIAATVEEEGQRLRPAIEAAASIGRTVEKLRDAVRTAGVAIAALSPAILAGMRAFMERDDTPGPGAATSGAPASQGGSHGE